MEQLKDTGTGICSSTIPKGSDHVQKNKLDEMFWRSFKDKTKEVEVKLSSLKEGNDDLQAILDDIKKSCQSLQQEITDATYYLPKYSLKSALSQLSQLKALLSAKEVELTPRKKFSFSNRKKNTTGNTVTTVPTVKPTEQLLLPNERQSQVGVSNLSDEIVQLHNEVVKQQDVELSRLDHCTVYIQGSPSSVYITKLSNTKIFVGPCQFSVFIEDCEDCQFSIACQQLRIHKSIRCVFSIHVTSGAIIEDCSEVAFAPYNYKYKNFQKHFQESGLECSKNNWDKVEDFNWLSKEPSPNWFILPINERTIVE